MTLLVAPIVVLMIVGWVGNAIHPALLRREGGHPLLLVALEPRFRWMVLIANRVDFVPFILVSTIRRMLSDPLFYALGYLYRDSAIEWLKRRFDAESGGIVATVERLFRKAAPVMVFLYPGIIVCTLAGATGMRPRLFVLLNFFGTLATGTAIYLFADVVEGPVDAITDFYSDNFRVLLVLSIGVTVLWLASQQRRGKSDIQALGELDQLIEVEPEPEPDEEGAS